jgi:hypothetical protein
MSRLLNQINSVNEIFRKAGSFNSDIGMFTGFTPLDIISSNFEHVPDKEIDILNGGMFNNPYNEIGMAAVGKTTLWIQALSSCVDNWYKYYGPVSECIFYNVENHTSPQRWKDITGYTDDMMRERVRFVTKPYSIVEIYNDIAALATQKLKFKDQLMVDTGISTIDGGTIKILPTTYVLIDSIAAIRTKTEFEFDKEGNLKDTDTIAGATNMDAMQSAKDNTMFINEVKKLCESAKICDVMINHLVEVPVLDRYNPPKPILPSMKFNQKLKGGNELIYQSFGVNLLSVRERLFNEKSKIYGDAVHGLIAFMEWLKNKNGPEGVKYPMVFDSATGYKPELTDFEILYTEMGYGISGSPLNYHLDILPEITFTRKSLLQKCYDNPLLARALGFTTRLLLVCKIILRCEPPKLTELSDLPYLVRVDLILQHSIDYPGYYNRGLVVPKELEEYSHDISETIMREERFNLSIEPIDIEIAKILKTSTMSDKIYSILGDTVKVGDTKYTVADGDKW